MNTYQFIDNLFSKEADKIRVDVLISKLQEMASRGCGLHYEIAEYNLLQYSLNYHEKLTDKEKPIFKNALEKLASLRLDPEPLEEVTNNYYSTLAEIRDNEL